MKIKEFIVAFEEKVSPHLQESWDNCGLQVGDVNEEITSVLTCLDITDEVVAEAIQKGANLIVSHHPLLFKGLKRIDQSTLAYQLIRHQIAVYSAHTSLDIAEDGLNDAVAKQLGLTNIEGFVETSRETYYKVATFVPSSHAALVREAIGNAGAGHMGEYSHCTFTATGIGRFKPSLGAKPFIGQVNELEAVEEEQIETIVASKDITAVIEALKLVHPYEEVAYDVIPMKIDGHIDYLGRVGSYEKSLPLAEFNQLWTDRFHYPARYGGVRKDSIQKVALVTGAGAEFMGDAVKRGVDLYITGDVKYHDMQRAKELGLMVLDGGHYGTEAIVKEVLQQLIHEVAPALVVESSQSQRDFFFYL